MHVINASIMDNLKVKQRALRADDLRPAIPESSLPSGPSGWIQPRHSDGPNSGKLERDLDAGHSELLINAVEAVQRTGSKTVAKSESDDDKEDRNAIGNDGAQPGGRRPAGQLGGEGGCG